LADEFIYERENQSLHAKEINAIHTSQIYKDALKSMFISKEKDDDESTSESNVYRLHGLPRFLIGDRDTRYTSHFFKNLMSELKTTLCLSTAYHPQSDGNTERCHRTIEQILRAFVHTDNFNWLSSLSLAEFAYNNNVHSSIGHSPFVANYGFDPRTPLNLIDPPIDRIPQQDNESTLQRLFTVHNLIVDHLKIAKAKQKHYANQNSTPKQFNVGDRVMLSTQNLKLLNQPSKKFCARYIGPYKIIEKISSQAYKLDLPSSMKVHPVFHIGLLKDFSSSSPKSIVSDNIPSTNDLIYGDCYCYRNTVRNSRSYGVKTCKP